MEYGHMALLDFEGFSFSTSNTDYITYGAVSGGSSTSAFGVNTGGPFGDNYIYSCLNASYVSKTLPSPVTTFFCGARISAYNANTIVLRVWDLNHTEQLGAYFTIANTTLSIYRGSTSGTLLGSVYLPNLSANSWFYMELGGVIASGTGGSATVRINGTTVLSVTGVNTAGGGNNNVMTYAASSNVGITGIYTTHWYLCDGSGPAPWNTFLGDIRVQPLAPTSNDSVQFTANGLASNYLNAAKVPPVPATDYNSDTGTVGHQDTFNLSSVTGVTTQTVLGVSIKVLANKSDTGGRAMATVFKSGATTDVGVSTSLGIGASLLPPKLYPTDPNTSAAWTLAATNAIKPGYKVSA